MEESENMMRDMVSMWKQGDEKGMSKLLFEDAVQQYPTFEQLYEGLFYQRNERMFKRIESLANEGGRYFVIVGAGHLVGDRGLISLLKKAGYKLERR